MLREAKPEELNEILEWYVYSEKLIGTLGR